MADAPGAAGPGPAARPAEPRRQARGVARRDAIVAAAAEIILTQGPDALTHRAVAARAGVPLASTTYYFTSLDDLVGRAGEVVVAGWVERALEVAAAVEDPARRPRDRAGRVAAVLDAVLPPGDTQAVRGFYQHLLGAGKHTALSSTYDATRAAFDDAVARLLAALGTDLPADLVVAVVDGAVVSALAEGNDPRAAAHRLVTTLLGPGGAGTAPPHPAG